MTNPSKTAQGEPGLGRGSAWSGGGLSRDRSQHGGISWTPGLGATRPGSPGGGGHSGQGQGQGQGLRPGPASSHSHPRVRGSALASPFASLPRRSGHLLSDENLNLLPKGLEVSPDARDWGLGLGLSRLQEAKFCGDGARGVGDLNTWVLSGSGHGCLGLPQARPWPLRDLVPCLENEGVRVLRRPSQHFHSKHFPSRWPSTHLITLPSAGVKF